MGDLLLEKLVKILFCRKLMMWDRFVIEVVKVVGYMSVLSVYGDGIIFKDLFILLRKFCGLRGEIICVVKL